MWTLDDIDEEYPDELYGTLYKEMYKDLYGTRPRGLTWPDIEDFFEDFDKLTDEDYSVNEEDVIDQDDESIDWLERNTLKEDEIFEEIGFDRRMNRSDDWYDWDE